MASYAHRPPHTMEVFEEADEEDDVDDVDEDVDDVDENVDEDCHSATCDYELACASPAIFREAHKSFLLLHRSN